MTTNLELDSKLVETTPQVTTVKFDLDINEVNVILAALQELPHRVADPILRKIMQHAQEQIKV